MARSFNGTSDYIKFTGVSNLTSNWTLAGWLKRTRTNTQDSIYARWSGSNSSGRQAYVYFGVSGGGNTNKIVLDVPFVLGAVIQSVTTIIDTSWHHWAITRSGNNWTIYIDGVQDNTSTNSVTQDSYGTAVIGTSQDGTPALFYSGSQAELGGWAAVLTAGEIAALYRGARNYMVRPGSLIWYPPLDGLSSPEPDLSGNAHNGTLTGTSLASSGPPVTLFTPKWPSNLDVAAAPPAGGGHILPFPWEQMSGGMQTMTGGMRG